MNKVMLVGRLTRDPELRSLPSGKHVAQFTMADSVTRYDDHACRSYHDPPTITAPLARPRDADRHRLGAGRSHPA